MAAAAIGVWIVVQIIGTRAEQLSLPVADYWGQWAPDLGDLRAFRGTVTDARLNGGRMPNGRVSSSDALRTSFRADGITTEASAVSDGALPGLSPIVSMYDREQRQIYLLGESGNAVVFRVRRQADAWKTRSPAMALNVPIVVGSHVRYRGKYERGLVQIEAVAPAPSRAMTASLGSWLLWTHLLPFGIQLNEWTLAISMLWSVGLALPIGFLLARSLLSIPTAATIVGLAILIGSAGVPLIMEMPLAPVPIWAAGVAGLIASFAVGRATTNGERSA
jgi:hypothetical protein